MDELTIADIDNLLSKIKVKPDLYEYMKNETEKIGKMIQIDNIIKTVDFNKCDCEDILDEFINEFEEEDKEDEDILEKQRNGNKIICEECESIMIGIKKSELHAAFKLFAKDLTYNLYVEYDYNDGCKYLEIYRYDIAIDDNITCKYYFKNKNIPKEDSYMYNKQNDYKWIIPKRSPTCEWYFDTPQSLFTVEFNAYYTNQYEFIQKDIETLIEKLDSKIFNTNAAWHYLKELNLQDWKINFMLYQFLIYVMDVIVVQPTDC